MCMEKASSYGATRKKREDVTYAQIERTATDILKTGVRPTVEALRLALGGGSARTLLDGLNRYWADLGNQVAGKPDTLRRLPAAVADLAEGLWKRALSVAMDAAQATNTQEDGQLSRLKNQLELRAHTLSQREVELDELLRARERTVKELEDHLRAAVSMLAKRDVTIAALEARLNGAQQETEAYRRRLGKVIQRAVARDQHAAIKRPSKAKKASRPPSRARPKQSRRKRPSKP
jgi:Plasmid replication region DNA-binding N-term